MAEGARKHGETLVWRIVARVDGSFQDADRVERRAVSLTRAVFGPRCLNLREGGQGMSSRNARALWADSEWAGEPLPETMRAYAMQGTPTLLLYDRRGGLRGQIFGPIPDLRLGAEIMALLQERADDAG